MAVLLQGEPSVAGQLGMMGVLVPVEGDMRWPWLL